MTEYRIAKARDELESIEDAALIHLDDAWARPQRNGEFGVEYPTHPVEDTMQIVDACMRSLKEGGWLIADADDWLLPRLINHLRDEWGDVAATYDGGGYRKTGYVTLLSSKDEPDRSTAGMYLTNAGYPVVFAHRGETDRMTGEAKSQLAPRPRESYGWGSVKPIKPYKAWIDALTHEDELVVEPCAGTAPASIAAEQLGRDAVAIDCEPQARDAYIKRRETEIDTTQARL